MPWDAARSGVFTYGGVRVRVRVKVRVKVSAKVRLDMKLTV